MTITHISENELALTKEITRLTAELNAERLFSKQAMSSVLEIAAQRDAARAEFDTDRQNWNRFHHLMKKYGWHPGRTDDDLIEILDAELEAMRREAYESRHCQCGYDDVCEFAREAEKLRAELAELKEKHGHS